MWPTIVKGLLRTVATDTEACMPADWPSATWRVKRLEASIAATPGSPHNGIDDHVEATGVARRLAETLREVTLLIEPYGRVRTQLGGPREPVRVAASRHHPRGAHQLRALHGHLPHRPGGAQDQHALARAQPRAPGQREPARQAGDPERDGHAVVHALGHGVHRGRVDERALGERAVGWRRVDEVDARAVVQPGDPLPARDAGQRRLGREREDARGLADVDGVQPGRQHVCDDGAVAGLGVLELAQLGRGVVLAEDRCSHGSHVSDRGAAYTGRQVQVAERIRADVTAAMKAGDKDRVTALRLVLSELQKDAKEGPGDEQAVLRRERKRRRESEQAYRDAGREDLAAAEAYEAKAIEAYLPAELSDDELDALVTSAVAETGASSPRDMGRVIKQVMAAAGGRADGKRVSTKVKEALGT